MPSDLSEHYDKMFAGHTLAAIVDSGSALCWRLEKTPGRRAYMVEVSVTPEGIHLMGDATPGHASNGVQAKRSLEWWVSEADAHYLAENFLTKQWVPEAAKRKLNRMIAEVEARIEDGAEPGDHIEDLTRATRLMPHESLFAWQQALGSVIDDLVDGDILDQSECYPSMAYDPGEVAILSAIHDRFRATFMEAYTLAEGRPVRRET